MALIHRRHRSSALVLAHRRTDRTIVTLVVCVCVCVRLMFEDIHANIGKLLEGAQDVKYHKNIGGGHYISVTTGFRCVDFRRWFLSHDIQDPKTTKKGVALRLDEWAKMRKIVETIDDNHPSLASAIPCHLQDHQNQMCALECVQNATHSRICCLCKEA